MIEFTPDEKQKIYEEEKARIEAQQQIKIEMQQKAIKENVFTGIGCSLGLVFGGLIGILVLGILGLIFGLVGGAVLGGILGMIVDSIAKKYNLEDKELISKSKEKKLAIIIGIIALILMIIGLYFSSRMLKYGHW